MAVLDPFRLDGRVAVVAGASRGIGAASAVAMAECGADIVIAARTKDALNEVAERVDRLGGRAVPVVADLGDIGAMPSVIDAAVSELGGVDIVVNVVGGSLPGPFMSESPESMEAAFSFNVTTAFEMTRLAVPHLLDRGGGSVVNIASAMGHLVDRGYVAYGTVKGALEHMTRLAAADLAPRIRVNAIAPGAIATDALSTVLTDELEQRMIQATPLRRLGTVTDIALGVVYLASDAGAYITGKILEIDGGLTTPNLSLGLPDL
jgi:7-alpha-hydroxysteroid dehydrogenase